MVHVARRHTAPLVQGRAADDLCLKIANTKRIGQVVRLTSAKCTIGSGRGCTLRLHAAGVYPLHCVVLRARVARRSARGRPIPGSTAARLAMPC